MLENIVDLVVYIFLSALALLVGSCIVGSIVAALLAVSRGSVTVNAGKRAGHVAETTVADDRMVATSAMVTHWNARSQLANQGYSHLSGIVRTRIEFRWRHVAFRI